MLVAIPLIPVFFQVVDIPCSLLRRCITRYSRVLFLTVAVVLEVSLVFRSERFLGINCLYNPHVFLPMADVRMSGSHFDDFGFGFRVERVRLGTN